MMMTMMRNTLHRLVKHASTLKVQAPPQPYRLLAERELSGRRGDKKDKKDKKGKNKSTTDTEKAKPSTGHPSAAAADVVPAPAPAPPITLLSKENLKVELGSKGLHSFHVAGILDVKVDNPAKNGFFKIKIESEFPEIKWKPAKKMEKTLFNTENILKHNSRKLPFPSGRPLHWTLKSEAESYVPLKIKCQTTAVDEEKTEVRLEYAAVTRFVLKKVVISVPIPLGVVPDVSSCTGIWRYRFNSEKSMLEWPMDRIDNSNCTGFLEFSVPRVDRSKFFPVTVKFTAACTYSNLKMCIVPLKGLNAPAKFVHSQLLEVNEYQLVD